MARLYLARDETATVVSRAPLRAERARLVGRRWSALIETQAPSLIKVERARSLPDAMLVVVPPLAACVVLGTAGYLELGVGAGAVLFFGGAYLEPVLRRRRAAKKPKPPPVDARILTAPAARAAFARVVELADSISETWPHLGDLVDVPEAESMLAEALWEISGVLARHQQLARVLEDLSRPDFVAQSATDETALELRTQLEATRSALTGLEADLTRRESGLRRAEQAGRDFIREHEMRRAIRAAQDSLRPAQPELTNTTSSDTAAELADQTRSVLDAYRELTAGLHPGPPA